MSGPMADALDKIFAEQMGSTYVTKGKPKKLLQQQQVNTIVENYKNDKLVVFKKGREHKSFPGFSLRTDIRNPSVMKETLFKHSKRMDFMTGRVPTGEGKPSAHYMKVVEPERDAEDTEDTEDTEDDELPAARKTTALDTIDTEEEPAGSSETSLDPADYMEVLETEFETEMETESEPDDNH